MTGGVSVRDVDVSEPICVSRSKRRTLEGPSKQHQTVECRSRTALSEGFGGRTNEKISGIS